jgi:predicted membrane-bound spermidine synthase
MSQAPRILFTTAVACLLISGIAGLVYEVVWARYLALFLGHTSHAVVVVLVAFMGGLAVGNAWLGSRADRVRRPLALYAWLEIGIGLYALVFPYYYEACHRAYITLARAWQPAGGGLFALRLSFSLWTILLPTILMGGTLPVMVKLVTRSLGELQARVAVLYFANSAGAVAGIVLADFWWIPTIGLQMTVYAGAALNLIVGGTALFLSGWLREEREPLVRSTTAAASTCAGSGMTYAKRDLNLAIAGIGLSGFVAMLYEVVWTRLLALALGSSTHAFSIMLITFITGIALGAWWVGRWKNPQGPMEAFGWAEIALALALAVSMFFYRYLPFWFVRLADMLARRDDVYPLYELIEAMICFLVMFVPTVCLGLTLPLASRIATTEVARTGGSVGAVFAVNTLGTVLGAAVTGLGLMPWLGMARTLALGIAINALVGLLLVLRQMPRSQRIVLSSAPCGAAVLVFLAGLQFDDDWRRVFTLGLWRNPITPTSLAQYQKLADDNHITYYKDGAGSTVSVHRWNEGKKDILFLKINGKTDASTGRDVATQLLSGHIPMLLHSHPANALVIGLGSGMTCGAVMRHPTMEHLDVVEISPEVVAAARLFGFANDQILDKPKTRLIVEDAKSFLQITDQRYDVIISEPSNPWMAGVAGVFGLEHYASCRARLKPGGLMVQWVHTYESGDAALAMVLATFLSVYPCVSVWQGTLGDLILIGSLQPLRVDLAELERRFELLEVKADLERIDLTRLPVLLARQLISEQNTAFILEPDMPRQSDYYPTLEYLAQRSFFSRSVATLLEAFDENASPRPTTLLARYLAERPLRESDFIAMGLYFSTHHLPDAALFRSALYRWQRDFPQSMTALDLAARLEDPRPAAELHAKDMATMKDQIFKQAETDPELLQLYVRFLLQTYRTQRSALYLPPTAELETALQRLLETDKGNQRVHMLRLAELAWDRGDDSACLSWGASALHPDTSKSGPVKFDLDPKAPARILGRMVESLWRAGKITDAWDLRQQARENGFVGKQAKNRDPLLDMSYRKVAASLAQAPPGRENYGGARQ